MFLSFLILSSIIIYNLYVYSKHLKNESFTNVNNLTYNIDNITNNNNNTTTNKNKFTSIILLGDSILKNNAYVNPNYSVEYLLKNLSKKNMYCLAKDGADIKAVYKQMEKIPNRLNIADSVILLSIGGNDLLEKNSSVENLFTQYEQLVRYIKIRFNKCKIIVLNLYIPPSIQKNMVLRHKLIQWNNLVKNYALEKNIDLIPLDTLLYEPIDFVEQYEPSEVGGVKIVKAIMLRV